MKVNFNIFIVIAVSVSMLLAACSPAAAPAPAATEVDRSTVSHGPSLKVLASTTFLADIAQNIAGERAMVTSLLPVGADPHSYQAAPTDVAKITESNVLILNGVEYEHFIEPLLENAGGERLVIEATAGLEVLQMEAHADEHEGEDHSPEAHSKEVCEQLEGKTAKEEIQAGTDADSAVELHEEGHAAGEEHAHEREIVTLKLNAQADSTFAGYILFDSEKEQGYAFTAALGQIAVTDSAGATLEAAQTLTIDCSGMSIGKIYKLPAGEYVVAVTGATAESVVFSAAPMHAEEGHEGHSHEAGDPHMWLDPSRVVKYVENIRDGLSQADPDGAETYKANAAAYIAQLNDLDKWITEQVNSIPAERRLLVTNHESLGYFAARYGFKVIGTVIPSLSTEASPSAQQMAGLVEQIKAAKAPAIFLGGAENPNLAKQIAEETGIKVVEGLYLETLTDGGPASTYIDMMRYNVTAIVEALK